MSQLTLQEIHQLAIKEVGDHLEAEGYEFLAVNSQLKRTPQFVCVKDKKLYFVLVQGTLYPNAPKKFDPVLIEKSKITLNKIMLNCILLGSDLPMLKTTIIH